MVVVCSPRHEFADRHSLELAELQGHPAVSFDSNLIIRRELDRELARHGVDVEVVMEFDNTETIKRAIEIDAGVGLLPAPTVQREVASGTLRAIPLRKYPLVRPLGIIQRRGKEPSKTTRLFIEFLLRKAKPSAGDLECVSEVATATTTAR
jgi:DNA-binding transcriptional LysR family regulator